MNGYTVCSFKKNGKKEYLVLDVTIDFEGKKALLQGFTSDGICFPFPLFLDVKLSEAEMLNTAFCKGVKHMKGIEGWGEDGDREELSVLLSNPLFLHTIKLHCKSNILVCDIDELLAKNNFQ